MAADPWYLVLQGKYGDAVVALSEHLRQTPTDTGARANRAAAYLCLRDYAAAALDYQELIQRRPLVDLGYLGLGVCQWCSGQPSAAVGYWKEALTAGYTDAAGGVVPPALLLYAARRLDDVRLEKEARALLRKHARRKGLVNWPGAIVPYLLGRLPLPDVRVAAERMTGSETLLTRHLCQLDFYRGVRGLCIGDVGTFQAGMRACAASANGYLEQEFYVATWEVDHAFPTLSS